LSGQLVVARLYMQNLHCWGYRERKKEQLRVACILLFQKMVNMRVEEWKRKFGNLQEEKEVLILTRKMSVDLRLLEKADMVICILNQAGLLSLEILFFNWFLHVVGYVIKTEKECAEYWAIDYWWDWREVWLTYKVVFWVVNLGR